MDTISKRIVILLQVYTNSPDGSADAVARHVSSVQITCFCFTDILFIICIAFQDFCRILLPGIQILCCM